MARIQIEVEIKGVYTYEAPAFGYGYETRRIYNMEAEDGAIYVWKTTAAMSERVQTDSEYDYAEEDAKGRRWIYNPINKGDRVVIAATVKGQSEYKGQPQTELTRVKVIERTFKAKTPEEIEAERIAAQEARKEEQINSLRDGDIVWRMPYKQYKEHYSDCETVEGSFVRNRHGATIEVIIREGRLVKSGVRGEHYSGYQFRFLFDGKICTSTFRAVSEETALRQLQKSFKGAREAECVKIYDYNAHKIF